ncbi:hypothetical protein B296_00029763, partial [Ensete ventricosum]
EGGEEDNTEGVRLERRRRQWRCTAAVVGEEEKKTEQRAYGWKGGEGSGDVRLLR